jgi:SPP1 family predicted phage head-tail adaptor
MKISAGMLKHPLSIYQRVTSQDAAGQPYETYVLIVAVRGYMKPLVGKDYLSAQQIVSEVTHDITIRYTARVKARHIIRMCHRHFEIMAVINPEEASEWLYLKCKEVEIA